MMRSADIVIIGSGAFGATTAYSLARQSGQRIVVLDRHAIASQTSPRAAGLAPQVRSTDLMTRLGIRALDMLTHFAEETGEPLDVVRSGSIKLARRPQDTSLLDTEVARGRRSGLDVALVAPDEVCRLHPLVEPNGILAAMYTPTDAYFEPSQVAIGFARAAQAAGATLQPDTEVTRVRIESGHVRGVETSQGPIDAPVVVDAAGAWARQIAASAGIHVPIVATRHQLLITEPIEGVRPELPIIRIMDAAVYIRPCDGGLLVGGYEEHPLQFSTDSLPGDVAGTPLEIAILSGLVDKIGELLPALRGLCIREHRGGIPTMTPDGQHIVGSVPGVEGMFVATGCNVAGLSISPAIGELLAEWIIRGASSVDLTPMSIARFDAQWHSEHHLRSAAAWQYSHFYTYESSEPSII